MSIRLHYLNDSIPGNRRSVLENASWSDVKTRITELDGGRKTELNLVKRDTAEELTIGGGRNRYIVSWLRSDGSNGTLISPDFADANFEVELIVGGQSGCFPRAVIVDLALTLSVARAFFYSGDLTGFFWD